MMFNIHRFEKIDSTNKIARNYPAGSVVIAEIQHKGKGRFDRTWISNKGGLWLSIIVKPQRKICEYTFIASLAVHNAINEKLDIKWPNDLYYKKKKLCGILTEIYSVGNKVEKIIVGMGINLNNKAPEEGISLKDIKGKEIDIDDFLNKVLDNFGKLSNLGLPTIIRQYKKNCSMLGKQVKVVTLNKEVKGKAIDIDNEGNLILETENGKLRLNEGDTSIL